MNKMVAGKTRRKGDNPQHIQTDNTTRDPPLHAHSGRIPNESNMVESNLEKELCNVARTDNGHSSKALPGSRRNTEGTQQENQIGDTDDQSESE